MRNKIKLVCWAAFGLFFFAGTSLAEGEQEAEVLKAIDSFFLAMYARDVDLARTVMMEQGVIRSSGTRNGELVIGTSTHADFLAAIGKGDAVLLERYWDPVVLVRKDIAMVWAPYDFHINGEFSHCGIDLFDMVKDEGQWKISGVTYTRETEGCEPSPLGAPAPVAR